MINGKIIILLVAVLLLIMGVVFGGFSIGMKISAANKKNVCTQKTWGTVTDIIKSEIAGNIGEAPMITWNPIFTYEANGQKISKRSNYGGAQQDFYLNQRVTVYYNPENPNEYYVQEEQVSKIQTIFLIVSLALLLAGGICFAAFLIFF